MSSFSLIQLSSRSSSTIDYIALPWVFLGACPWTRWMDGCQDFALLCAGGVACSMKRGVDGGGTVRVEEIRRPDKKTMFNSTLDPTVVGRQTDRQLSIRRPRWMTLDFALLIRKRKESGAIGIGSARHAGAPIPVVLGLPLHTRQQHHLDGSNEFQMPLLLLPGRTKESPQSVSRFLPLSVRLPVCLPHSIIPFTIHHDPAYRRRPRRSTTSA